MRTIPVSLGVRNCPCGALVEIGAKRCQKCRARMRYFRRKIRND